MSISKADFLVEEGYCRKAQARKQKHHPTTTDPPLIYCFPFGDGMRFWCCHCRTWHSHGGHLPGHRNAHCGFISDPPYIDSPYRPGGYLIKLLPKKELLAIQKQIEEYLQND